MNAKETKRSASEVGSPFPIDNGASTRTLWRRVGYGGRKGRAARRRLTALERRFAPYVDTVMQRGVLHMRALMDPIFDLFTSTVRR